MRGSISERRPGYWQVRVYVGLDPITGKRREVSRGVRGKRAAADDALRKLIGEIQSGKVAVSTKGTLAYLLDKYIAHCEANDRSPTTVAGYKAIAGQIKQAIGHIRLDELGAAEIDDYYRTLRQPTPGKKGMSAARVQRYHRFLSSALNQAIKWGYIQSSPGARATAPTVVVKPLKAPEPADVLRLIEAAGKSGNKELGIAFRLLAATGMRRGEVCGLRWSDLDGSMLTIRRAIIEAGKGLQVKTTKTGRERTITLDSETLRRLEEHRFQQADVARWAATELVADAYILANMQLDPDGSVPWRPHRLTLALSRLAQTAEYPGRLHDLRHAHASSLLNAGVPLAVVSARLGHTNSATTLRVYNHAMAGGDQAAAEMTERLLSKAAE